MKNIFIVLLGLFIFNRMFYNLLVKYIWRKKKMEELREISSKLYDTVEKLKENKDIEKAVGELHEIRDKLRKIVKENAQ